MVQVHQYLPDWIFDPGNPNTKYRVVEVYCADSLGKKNTDSRSALELYHWNEDLIEVEKFHQSLIDLSNHPYWEKIIKAKIVVEHFSRIKGIGLNNSKVVSDFEKMIRVKKTIETYSLNIYERATKQDLAK